MPVGVYSRKTVPAIQRLLAKTEQHGECWIYKGAVNHKGYGSYFHAGTVDGKKIKVAAHRFSFEYYVRPLEPGEMVLHRCDRPACVNPAHLLAGTAADNTADMVAKGRHKFKGRKRLLQIDEVRAIRASDLPHGEIAKQYGVTRNAVTLLRNGHTWRRV